MTIMSAILWYPLSGITLQLEYGFFLVDFCVGLALLICARAILICGFVKIMEEEVENDQVHPSLPDVVIGVPIEVVRLIKR